MSKGIGRLSWFRFPVAGSVYIVSSAAFMSVMSAGLSVAWAPGAVGLH